MDIPMCQYRLTLRMEQAAQEIAQGATLTQATCTAGFADPAHFCRICRRMFGSAPRQLPSFKVRMPGNRTSVERR
ncbi:MAG: helix-turn-helix domain-containing protein [Acidobacteriales bacterium]|nr:helix-turn-helix domain-containing protein [Terriglobales bacterium]